MAKYFIGVDNGGTMTKAALYDFKGSELAVSSMRSEMVYPEPGFTEKDPEQLWEANCKVIREVIEQSGISSEEIAGLAVTGYGNGMYFVDAKGATTYPGIVSADSRAKDYVEQWYKDGTFEAVLPKTMQSIWSGQYPPLLAWFQENRRDVLEKTERILNCKDFIKYRLTGEACAEITDISGTNTLNIKERAYDTEILSHYGLGEWRHLFPPIKQSVEVNGYVTEEAAAKTGLKAGTPVAGGLFDIDACAIATGVKDEDVLCMIVGTWGINQYISKKPVVDPDLFMTSIYCKEDYWLITEGSTTSASNLEWFVNQFLGEEKNRLEAEGKSVFTEVNAMVGSTTPMDADIIFLPFLYGSTSNPSGSASLFGMNGWHTRAHVMRAIYEGIIFAHKEHVDKLLKYRSMPSRIRISGGATRSKEWMQMFADVFQVPVEITEGTELGTLGAAICAAIATDAYDSFDGAVDGMVRMKTVVEPNPQYQEIYQKKYKRYQQVIKAVAPLW